VGGGGRSANWTGWQTRIADKESRESASFSRLVVLKKEGIAGVQLLTINLLQEGGDGRGPKRSRNGGL